MDEGTEGKFDGERDKKNVLHRKPERQCVRMSELDGKPRDKHIHVRSLRGNVYKSVLHTKLKCVWMSIQYGKFEGEIHKKKCVVSGSPRDNSSSLQELIARDTIADRKNTWMAWFLYSESMMCCAAFCITANSCTCCCAGMRPCEAGELIWRRVTTSSLLMPTMLGWRARLWRMIASADSFTATVNTLKACCEQNRQTRRCSMGFTQVG